MWSVKIQIEMAIFFNVTTFTRTVAFPDKDIIKYNERELFYNWLNQTSSKRAKNLGTSKFLLNTTTTFCT